MMQKIEESEKAGSLLVTASLFTFLYFHLKTSKFIYFQHEARCSEQRITHDLSTSFSSGLKARVDN